MCQMIDSNSNKHKDKILICCEKIAATPDLICPCRSTLVTAGLNSP